MEYFSLCTTFDGTSHDRRWPHHLLASISLNRVSWSWWNSAPMDSNGWQVSRSYLVGKGYYTPIVHIHVWPGGARWSLHPFIKNIADQIQTVRWSNSYAKMKPRRNGVETKQTLEKTTQIYILANWESLLKKGKWILCQENMSKIHCFCLSLPAAGFTDAWLCLFNNMLMCGCGCRAGCPG